MLDLIPHGFTEVYFTINDAVGSSPLKIDFLGLGEIIKWMLKLLDKEDREKDLTKMIEKLANDLCNKIGKTHEEILDSS